ncbi:hypothetical protein [Streptomyces anulatus]|uniref:hypothetical protein n=1 Tax=Streptomyces anulatus TaxID=1892 RepID=UPI0036C199C3
MTSVRRPCRSIMALGTSEGSIMAETLPDPASDDTTRFEVAPDPDGTLIPIPSQAPRGKPIRDDARITVGPRQERGYYVQIYNGPSDPPGEVEEAISDLLSDLLTETGQKAIEDALFVGAPAVLEFLASAAGVLASVLTTSPLLNEQFFRGVMEDGTAVVYVVLTPKDQ